ncbi:hypothetical protein [Azotobacter chroococcum]|uniref:Uncharacterized protein n=1 Tax=Azotobacter chroococcum TaxID=353 RepID=A0AAP9YBD4_9GAMM|nr:hypothetical protein [Azotobacter chroococcum]QQE87916.1 hypothetical protein GKQ51_16865 [Azotobacter chroococcum]
MNTLDWDYVGRATFDRRTRMQNPPPFSRIIDQLKDEMNLVCFHREQKSSDQSYSRAVFCATVEPALFDLFFNSPTGYRGEFFISPERGVAANRLLLQELSPKLIQFAAIQDTGIDQAWLLESLSKLSAKAWLAEESLSLCSKCAGEWSTSYVSELEIRNGRWECSDHAYSVWGRQAPCLTKIRFFGGFINSTNQEWLAEHKQSRAAQIWQYGWT